MDCPYLTNEHLLTAIYLFLKYILIGSRDPGRERNGKGTSRVREERGTRVQAGHKQMSSCTAPCPPSFKEICAHLEATW